MNKSKITSYALVPIGTDDLYAAGLDENSFLTAAEARAAIPALRALGEEWDHEWDVVGVCVEDKFSRRIVSRACTALMTSPKGAT